jgi:hypothetical protein
MANQLARRLLALATLGLSGLRCDSRRTAA